MDCSGAVPAQSPGPTRAPFNWFPIVATTVSGFLALLILYPLVVVVFGVVTGKGVSDPSSDWFQVVQQPDVLKSLSDTFAIIGISAVISAIVGSVFAWLVERTDIGMRGLSRFLPIVPLLVPAIGGAIGWVMLAAPRAGYLNHWIQLALGTFGVSLDAPLFNIFSWGGLIWVYVIYMVPQVYLTVSAALVNLDPSLEEASRVSGAGPLKTLVKVTIPAIGPSIIAGLTVAVILGIALYSVPVIIGTQAGVNILAVRIVNLMLTEFPPKIGAALALGAVIALVIGAMTLIQSRMTKAGRHSTIGGKGTRAAIVNLGWLRWPARLAIIAYIAVGTVLPFGALVIASLQRFWVARIDVSQFTLRNYEIVFGAGTTALQGLRNSIGLAVIGACVVMLIAAISAVYTQRVKWPLLGNSLEMITKIPAMVSNLIIGIAFIAALSGPPFNLHGTIAILALVYLVLYMPQATITASAALTQVGRQVEEASLMSGASQGRTFIRITLPLMLPGLMAGWTMLFVLIAGDLTASAMLSSTNNPVIGSTIIDLWNQGSFTPLAAFSTVVTVLMSVVVLLSMRLTRRRD